MLLTAKASLFQDLSALTYKTKIKLILKTHTKMIVGNHEIAKTKIKSNFNCDGLYKMPLKFLGI